MFHNFSEIVSFMR